MSFAQKTESGSGTVRLRIMIEGWPEMFVTDPSITCTSIADSRTVVPGLLYEGLQIQDRIIPGEAKVTASGNTPSPTLKLLVRLPVAALGASVDHNDSDFTLKGGATLVNGSVYHLGTEAVRVISWPDNVTRTVWDTQAQEHNLSYYDATKAVYIYDRPPTMEGRRIYLYEYGESDTVTGLGTLIWRGIVSRAPKLDRDCITWLIEALPITHVLRQSVAGDTTETHPVGIYHHSTCCFGFYLETDDNDARTIYRYPENDIGTPDDYGLDTEQTLIDAINTRLADAIVDEGMGSAITSITLVKDSTSPGKFSFAIVPADVIGIRLVGGSPLLGWCDTYNFGMYINDPADPDNQIKIDKRDTLGGIGVATNIIAGATYIAPLEYHEAGYQFKGNAYQYDGNGVAAPLGHAGMIFNSGNPCDGFRPGGLFVQATVGGGTSQFPAWRLHVDKELDGTSMVHVEGSLDRLGNYRATDTGETGKDIAGATAAFNWVLLEEKTEPFPTWDTTKETFSAEQQFEWYAHQRGFYGILLAGSTIVPIRRYAWGSVTTFVQALKDQSVNANDGDTPFITDADLTTWALQGGVTSTSITSRQYAFTRPKSVETILAEECKLAAHLMRIESDGRIGIVQLPLVTDVETVDAAHTITDADVITPAGTFGEWPGVEPQRDGLITTIQIQEFYDAVADDWTDQPKVYQDPDAIATHKTRGKSPMAITPYSRLSGVVDRSYGKLLSSRILGFFARDYQVITIKVPWTKWAVLCGDAVSLTNRLVPDGLGSRGIVGRRGVVVERRWNLDPKLEDFGTLSIWIAGQPTTGYAPGAIATALTDHGSNLFTLDVDETDDRNIQLSPNHDGLILGHFAVGYAVKLIEVDSVTPSIVTGTVTAVNASAGTIQVQFSGPVTFGAGDYALEFDDHAACTSDQRKYAFSAGNDLALSTGGFARRLA